MADKAVNVQDVFLNHVRKNKIPLTIFLINGVKLQGVVTWFDNFSLLLRREGHSQLVYKHAISTIMPQGSIHLFEGAAASGGSCATASAQDDDIVKSMESCDNPTFDSHPSMETLPSDQ